jgi:hypothetical protein
MVVTACVAYGYFRTRAFVPFTEGWPEAAIQFGRERETMALLQKQCFQQIAYKDKPITPPF